MGLFTTVVSVLSAQEGHLSVTAKVIIVVTTVCGASMLALSAAYSQLSNNMITDRDREVAEASHAQMEHVYRQTCLLSRHSPGSTGHTSRVL